MSTERVTDAMAKAARLRFEADEADDVVDWYAVVGAALSAADAVRDGSASVIYPYYTIDGTGEGDGSANGAMDVIKVLENYKAQFASNVRPDDEDDEDDAAEWDRIDAAIAALRQPVTLREVTERDAYSMTCALSNVAIIPMLTMLAALRTILPHGVPAIAHQESRNGSEGESA